MQPAAPLSAKLLHLRGVPGPLISAPMALKGGVAGDAGVHPPQQVLWHIAPLPLARAAAAILAGALVVPRVFSRLLLPPLLLLAPLGRWLPPLGLPLGRLLLLLGGRMAGAPVAAKSTTPRAVAPWAAQTAAQPAQGVAAGPAAPLAAVAPTGHRAPRQTTAPAGAAAGRASPTRLQLVLMLLLSPRPLGRGPPWPCPARSVGLSHGPRCQVRHPLAGRELQLWSWRPGQRELCCPTPGQPLWEPVFKRPGSVRCAGRGGAARGK
jgi:hypothetical protein